MDTLIEQRVNVGRHTFTLFPSRQEPGTYHVYNQWGWDCGTLVREPAVFGTVWYCRDVPRAWPEFRTALTPAALVRDLAPLVWENETDYEDCVYCGGNGEDSQGETCRECDGRGEHHRNFLVLARLQDERGDDWVPPED